MAAKPRRKIELHAVKEVDCLIARLEKFRQLTMEDAARVYPSDERTNRTVLQTKWLAAVAYMRKQPGTLWVLDKVHLKLETPLTT